jgi:hypothetical protein
MSATLIRDTPAREGHAPDVAATGASGHACRYQYIAALFCFLFGLSLIAHTQLAGDGGWYWYASALMRGTHLYSDLRLALQPFFVLETELSMVVFGNGWLAGRILAVAHLLLLVSAMLAISRKARWPDWQKAVILAASFFVLINFEQYRFDDYHVPAHAICIWSIYLLLQLGSERTRDLRICTALGVMAGVFITTRLNEGAAFLCGVLFIMLFATSGHRLLSSICLVFSASATVRLVVALTGDSFGDYLSFSVLKAAGIKGGASHLMLYPFTMPLRAIAYLFEPPQLLVSILVIAIAAGWVWMLRPFIRERSIISSMKAASGIILIIPVLWLMRLYFAYGTLITLATAVLIPFCYVAGITAAVRGITSLFRRGETHRPRVEAMLVLLPLALLAAEAMSSAGYFGLYEPIGMLMLITPLTFAAFFRKQEHRRVLVTASAVLALSGATYKYLSPASWHTYQAPRMFTVRQVFDHPSYGPMIIDDRLRSMFDELCSTIRKKNRNPTVLSLPFPYINYYCAIPPWKNYIQTFFDTSGRETIETLMADLNRDPPDWILYQQQLANLAMHEQQYNGGNRLPQRDLDDLIGRKTQSGEWLVVAREAFGRGSEWFLIETRPSTARN